MTETWKPIPGTEGRYEASDLGRVRSWVMAGGKRRAAPYVLKPSLSARGYPRVKVGRSTPTEVHVLVMRAFVGPPSPGLETRHLDGDPLNATLANLRYGTRVENMADRTAHGHDWNANKTHCPSGHPYTDENTYRNPQGHRQCLTCKRASNRLYMRGYAARKRAAA